MARTEITITSLPRFGLGADPAGTTGDAANDHQVSVNDRPVCLIAVNSNAATVDYNWELLAGTHTWNGARETTVTVPAAAGGVDGVSVVWIDIPSSVLASNSKLRLESADANFGDVTFYAVVGVKTPLR